MLPLKCACSLHSSCDLAGKCVHAGMIGSSGPVDLAPDHTDPWGLGARQEMQFKIREKSIHE